MLVPLRSGGSRAPLFGLHDLSGNVVAYRRLTVRLGDNQPVYGPQYPGQHLTEPLCLAFGKLAARLCVAIRRVQPVGPYYLAGSSLGGAIAYEIARHLRAAGKKVALITLLDTAAPGADPRGPARVLRHIGEFAHRPLPPWTWLAYFARRWRNPRRRQHHHLTLYQSTTADGLGARLGRLATEVLSWA